MIKTNKILLKFFTYAAVFFLFYKYTDFIIISAENYNIIGLSLGFGLIALCFTLFDVVFRWWFTLLLTPIFIFTMGTGFLLLQIVIVYVIDYFVTYIDITNAGLVVIAIATTVVRFLIK